MFSDHRKQRAGVAKIPSDGEELFVTRNKKLVLYLVFYFGSGNRSPIDPEPIFRLKYVINEKIRYNLQFKNYLLFIQK